MKKQNWISGLVNTLFAVMFLGLIFAGCGQNPAANTGNQGGNTNTIGTTGTTGNTNNAATTFSISGKATTAAGAGIANATISLAGASAASVATDSNGNYNFATVANGSYTLTPAKSGYTFNPTSKSVSVNGANVSGQDFVGSQQPAGSSIKLPKTGQTTCYDSSGNVITCAGTGQDGELQKGVAWPNPRFTDNADGTITDNLTGLQWLKDANCIKTKYPSFDNDSTAGDGAVTWQHSLDFVKGINTGAYSNCGAGHIDWRLPNRKELKSLIDRSKYNPALPSGHPFTNVQSYYYWSSTTYSYYTGDAWGVGMFGGSVFYSSLTINYYVWPVR